MKKEFRENNLGSHTGVLNLKAYNGRYKNGFVISLKDGDKLKDSPIDEKTLVIFNEFGTGINGQGTGDLAGIYEYKYNVGSAKKGPENIPDGAVDMWGLEYCLRVTDKNTWWYFKNGKWWWSKGQREGKNMFADLAYELSELAPRKYNALIDGLTTKYGRKK